jgi:hypothetical protein
MIEGEGRGEERRVYNNKILILIIADAADNIIHTHALLTLPLGFAHFWHRVWDCSSPHQRDDKQAETVSYS